MVTQFPRAFQAAENYVRALEAAYQSGFRVVDPSFALSRDPDAYEKIVRDSAIASKIRTRYHLVAGTDWTLEPGGDTKEDKIAASALRQVIKKTRRLDSSLFNLSKAVLLGSTFAYIRGKRVPARIWDGKLRDWWIPQQLVDMDKRRFRLTSKRTGEKLEVEWQLRSIERRQYEVVLHPEWIIKHTYDDTEDSLGYGTGLLDELYFYWYAKMKVLNEGLNGAERWAQGFIMAKVDTSKQVVVGTTTATLADKMLEEIEKNKGRHVLVTDKDDEVTVIPGPGQGHQIVMDLVNYLDQKMTELLLGSNLPTSATTGGSFALAEVQENMTDNLVRYDRALLSETLTDDLVRLVWRLNRSALSDLGLDSAQMPSFKISSKKITDPEKDMRVIKAALEAGMDVVESEGYEKAQLTVPSAGDKVIKRIPPTQVPTLPGLP